MPIKSYLAYARAGQKESLCKSLSMFEQCEVLPSENYDVIVLVTDTSGKEEEDLLQEKIEKLEDLQQLAMVSGYKGS